MGTFTQALYDEASKGGWVVISMKKDWKRMFAFGHKLHTQKPTILFIVAQVRQVSNTCMSQ